MHKFFCCPKLPGTPMGSPDFYSASVRQKISTKYRCILLLWIKFFEMTEISQTQKRFPEKNSQHCESKKVDRELWYTPPVHRILRYPEVLKPRRDPLRICFYFLALWDNFPSTENHDIPPLMQNFLWCPKVLGTPMGSPVFFISLVWNKKISTTKHCDIPLSWINFFNMSEVSETLNGSPTKFLSTVRQKSFNKVSWHNPLMDKNLRYVWK